MTPPDKFPTDWSGPTEVPTEAGRQKEWQKLNRDWWENNPMRYDQEAGVDRIAAPEGSLEFFQANDAHFFAETKTFMPWKSKPFDPLMPFAALAQSRVLEIGCGLGCHAQLLSTSCKEYVGIDLTERAMRLTTKRLVLNGLANATVVRMDAEKLEFSDASFDFIWSWGVIHHSSNTPAIINEIHRVLKPGGRVVLMVYHRSFWHYWIKYGIFRGIFRGDFIRIGSVHKIAQHYIDGAFTRYYTAREFSDLLGPRFRVERTPVYGMQQDVLVMFPGVTLKRWARKFVPSALTRFFTHTLRWGGFLVCDAVKK